ncbi:hypothetical protein FIBSPDRAFT_59778 [Athelia psychrophila]|uniref:Uncharacterized protein n=1 Tax=Athelia psychrophila TaxID=1759441 RepID=A0A166F490_9AGAM|nr:hypothetical protein FIBSPDRAFT_59778 [Fibularhizoctonia sp. CBS 109695]
MWAHTLDSRPCPHSGMRGRRGRKGARTEGTTRRAGFEAEGHRWDTFQMGAALTQTTQCTPFRHFLLVCTSPSRPTKGPLIGPVLNLESRTCPLTQQPSSLPPLSPPAGTHLDAAYLSKFKRVFWAVSVPAALDGGGSLWSSTAPTSTIAPTFAPCKHIGVRHTHHQRPTATVPVIACMPTKTCAILPLLPSPESSTPHTLKHGWCRRANKHSFLLRPRPHSCSALRISVLVTHGQEARKHRHRDLVTALASCTAPVP